MTSSPDRKNNGQVDPGNTRANGLGPAATRPGSTADVEAGAGQAEASVPVGGASGGRSQRGARRDAARRTEQLAILSVAIVLGGVGLAFHPLWIAAVVLMAVLWGYMASDIRSRGGGVVSDLVGTVVGEAKELSNAASGQVSAPDQDAGPAPLSSSSADGATPDNDSQGEGHETVEADGQAPPLGPSDDQEPTRKELYAQAQEADIQGRSGMSKDELKQALKG
jgi:hypothetical protein